MSDDVDVEMDDVELSELLDFGGARTRLTTAEARLILRGMDAFEAEIDDAIGWGMAPALYVVTGHTGPLGTLVGAEFRLVPVPAHRWGPVPGEVLEGLAQTIGRVPGLARDIAGEYGRAVAVAFACEAWQRKPGSDVTMNSHDHPEIRADELRVVQAIDLDGRQYLVSRARRAGQRHVGVKTDQSMRREMAEADDPQVRHIRDTYPDAMPRAPRALGAIMRALAAAR